MEQDAVALARHVVQLFEMYDARNLTMITLSTAF